eukprot:350921-Chlamydomonas_euryale.AAC.1
MPCVGPTVVNWKEDAAWTRWCELAVRRGLDALVWTGGGSRLWTRWCGLAVGRGHGHAGVDWRWVAAVDTLVWTGSGSRPWTCWCGLAVGRGRGHAGVDWRWVAAVTHPPACANAPPSGRADLSPQGTLVWTGGGPSWPSD